MKYINMNYFTDLTQAEEKSTRIQEDYLILLCILLSCHHHLDSSGFAHKSSGSTLHQLLFHKLGNYQNMVPCHCIPEYG